MNWRALTVFLLSLILYVLCLDPGASLWDCPEYILVAWGMEVGHPPGNPTWQLLANVVAHLGGTPDNAALLINLVSAFATAIAASLLCEIIYIMVRYAILRGGGSRYRRYASYCGVCGALCFAWCDSVIFSAVEAEVYALSIMFTALTVWLALKWATARLAGRRRWASRIAVLTWYVMGLSMGVHELNLLALPAMGLIYWFVYRSLPARRRPLRATLGTTLWGALFFVVGCATYLVIPIRAAANPPVNQGDPSDFRRFAAYYSREQYGSKPLLYGRTPYSQPLRAEVTDSAGRHSYSKYYLRDKGNGMKEYVYPDELNMWFPRMTSSKEADIENYGAWSGMDTAEMVRVYPSYAVDSAGRQVWRMDDATGERVRGEAAYRPTYMQQLRYLLSYQIGYMYLRYLMWNFSGRQNNMPSTGEIDHGNFITGIPPIDDMMLGAQTSLPSELKDDNRGYNRYFMIPFLFGLAGALLLISYGRRGRRVLYVTGLLFLFTGIGIVVYLNQDPGEPRERDYSFLGSFMAFAIWIGCAFSMGFRGILRRRKGERWLKWLWTAAVAGVPLLMLSQTYDDHDRSGRDVASAIGDNILNSLPQGAIIFVDGDNVIFPLWYAQEVSGTRRDVTVVEVGYLPTRWYRTQLAGVGVMEVPENDNVSVAQAIDEILEFNERSGSPRPVYWHTAIAERPYFKNREGQADQTLFTYRLRPDDVDSVAGRRGAMREGTEALSLLRSGGTENPRFYAEPYVAWELARQRRAIFRLARRYRVDGDTVMADSVSVTAQRLWPFGKVPPVYGDPQPASLKKRRREEFRRYYDAMPESRRGAISRESLEMAE